MKNIKRIVLFNLLSFLTFFLISCKPEENEEVYTYEEADFSFVLTVDKTEVQLFDTVTATITLTNKSGKDIILSTREINQTNISHAILISIYDKSTWNGFVLLNYGVAFPRPKIIIENNQSITKSREFIIGDFSKTTIGALLYCSAGYKEPNFFSIESNTIDLTII